MGGKVQWGAHGDAIPATILDMSIDEHGDPWFTLTFADKDVQEYFKSKRSEELHECHKDVIVGRDEIFPMGHG